MSAVERQTNRVELVAPAGNFQKLKVAVAFGADAVYLGGQRFSLRAQSENFIHDTTAEAIDYAHARGVRTYLLLNIIPHNEHLPGIREEIRFLTPLCPDAVVVSDVGVFELVREISPALPVHVSTQANVTNWKTAKFWERLGAKRIILARELSLKQISEIRQKTDLELEIFVHGAMCMAYSGRCFMSKHFVGRDANLGDCAQPCRWAYEVSEKTRPGEVLEAEENNTGTLIFSSRDLCMIEHLPEIINSGVSALKIEGRMKSAYYVGIATRSYRQAIDAFYSAPNAYETDPAWGNELRKTSNRAFTSGFYLGEMQKGLTPAGGADRKSTHSFVGIITETRQTHARVEVRGRIARSDVLECICPKRGDFLYAVESMLDAAGNEIEKAQPNQVVEFAGLRAEPYSLMRKPAS